MTEQDLFNYEMTKIIFDDTSEKLKSIFSKLYSISSVDFNKIHTSNESYNSDIIPDLIEKKQFLQRAFDEACKEYTQAKSDYDKALSVLNCVERAYCHKRYILSLNNKEIALSLNVPIESLYFLRKSILEKIKDI
ncbi:MAG: hypothetical protein II980_05665 [Clostridia bacterium]|nr:hypothetical protein [Clostridia bacterium]